MKPTLTLLFCLVALIGRGQTDTVDKRSMPYDKSKVFDGTTNEPPKLDSSLLKYCSCDSLKLSWGTKLYNIEKRIVYCGYLKNYKMTYGLHFVYSAEGKLTKIEKYYEGKVIGECKIE